MMWIHFFFLLLLLHFSVSVKLQIRIWLLQRKNQFCNYVMEINYISCLFSLASVYLRATWSSSIISHKGERFVYLHFCTNANDIMQYRHNFSQNELSETKTYLFETLHCEELFWKTTCENRTYLFQDRFICCLMGLGPKMSQQI